ncbi:MAG: hypothetical protein K8953_07615, partial [Proteobacteria bacterium]|nr:hypothetical protein [Pseudomonadota bacterium]
LSYCNNEGRATATATRDVCAPALYYCHLNPESAGCGGIVSLLPSICTTLSNVNKESAACGLNNARWGEHSYTRVGNALDGDKVKLTIYEHYSKVPEAGLARVGFLHGADSGLGVKREINEDIINQSQEHFATDFTETYEDDDGNTIGFIGGTTGGFAMSAFVLFDNISSQTYAGLLPDINVGAPLPDSNAPEATWSGKIALRIANFTNETNDFDFKLTVNFEDESLKIKDGAYGFGGNRVSIQFLNVKYDNAGLISGQVRSSFDGTFKAATLTGLIGESGAVGVFLSNEISGGFVASPDVGVVTSRQFDDWKTDSRGTRNTSFARGGDLTIRTEISKTDALANFLAGGTSRQYLRLAEGLAESDAILTPNTPITTLTLADTYFDSDDKVANLNGDSTNGVSLFAVDVAQPSSADKTTRFYSGLLAETTLIPPV